MVTEEKKTEVKIEEKLKVAVSFEDKSFESFKKAVKGLYSKLAGLEAVAFTSVSLTTMKTKVASWIMKSMMSWWYAKNRPYELLLSCTLSFFSRVSRHSAPLCCDRRSR